MSQWWQDLRKIIQLVVFLLSLVFLLFIVNQFLNLYHYLAQLHPYLSIGVVSLLAGGLLYYLGRLIKYWRRYPRIIELDPQADDTNYYQYLADIHALLQQNPHLHDFNFTNSSANIESEVLAATHQLKQMTLPIIQQNASAIFLTTAISQNGALDSLMVLYGLIRMVWQLAQIYQTRPNLKGLFKLYWQVAGVVLMARTLEELDLIEGQLEPLITSIIGESIASAVPGMVPITNLVISSLMEGAVNAFLTLRVGFITQSYLGIQVRTESSAIRRSSSLQAIDYMTTILKDNSKVIIKTAINAVKNASKDTAKRWLKF